MDTGRKHSEQQMKQSRWGFRGKTVWNWLDLLIVPLALAVIGLAFSVQQDARQQRIENQRAEAERELAVQRAQDESLQAYLDQMSTLMLEKDLRNSEKDSEVRTLAQARTLTVLGRVDTSRKDEITKFLLEADLVREVGGSAPIISLDLADLHGADMRYANLKGAQLDRATLDGADLHLADLRGAYMFSADLDGADLSAADLSSPGANSILSGGTVLIGARLRHADLTGADLSYTYLGAAHLNGATLDGADLHGADLSDAKGCTDEQLMEAESLKGATMPNGQEYEDWIKDK
jgi:uncharacterized protein YjbI with pentapeptide repeats